MNANQLSYLKTIGQTGNIQEAALILQKNVSTLTRTLSAAQEEYGFPVFTRRGKALVPTPEGEVILQYADDQLRFFSGLNAWAGKEVNWTDNVTRYLLEIHRRGSISGAAEKLFISQASLSQSLMEMEKKVGTKLFFRSKTGTAETEKGRELMEKLDAIQKRDNRLRRDLAHFSALRNGAKTESISIGFLPQMGANLLPVVLPAFMARYPGVKISLTEDGAEKLLEKLKTGEMNFCILGFVEESQTGNMVFEDFFKDSMYLIVPESMREMFSFRHGQMLRKKDLSQLSGHPFIMPDNSKELVEITHQILAESNVQMEIRFTAKNMETARRLASAGVGVTIMPLTCLDWRSEAENADYYPISDELYTRWMLKTVHRKDRKLRLADMEFLRMLKEGLEQIR